MAKLIRVGAGVFVRPWVVQDMFAREERENGGAEVDVVLCRRRV